MMKIEHARNPLRRARLTARLELQDLAERTCISPRMLRHIDDGEFDRLPAGIYARAWVRSVADALGLDPAEVLRDLEDVLPRVEPVEESGTAAAPTAASAGEPMGAASWSLATAKLEHWARRAAAAVLDGLILTVIALIICGLTAAAAGVAPKALGTAGAIGISTLVVTLAAVYFLVFAGIGGRTPGAALVGCAVGPSAEEGPLDLAAIGRRAGRDALTGLSIVIDTLAREDLTELLRRKHFARG